MRVSTDVLPFHLLPVRSQRMAELEGFICPLCRQDLKGFRQLEAHFREDHDESTRSKLKTNIKSFFEKVSGSRNVSCTGY